MSTPKVSALGSSADKVEEEKSSTDQNELDNSQSQTSASQTSPSQEQWQAIYAPQYNAYYFYNVVTQETTWTNPLQSSEGIPASGDDTLPTTSSATDQPSSQSAEEKDDEGTLDSQSKSQEPALTPSQAHLAALRAAAIAQGIDPLLAHLDPTLLAPPGPGSASGASSSAGMPPVFSAKFNARTGQFTPASSRTPGHLSEYERAKRMSEFYFDVEKWEAERGMGGSGGANNNMNGMEANNWDGAWGQEDWAAQGYPQGPGQADEGAEGSKKRKRPTKKDLERFKEQKRLKKIAKTAWLRT